MFTWAAFGLRAAGSPPLLYTKIDTNVIQMIIMMVGKQWVKS